MGVKNCSKRGCGEIMCQSYIDSIGYICTECKEEFKDYLTKNDFVPKNSYEAKEYLRKFMETEKGSSKEEPNFDLDKFLE